MSHIVETVSVPDILQRKNTTVDSNEVMKRVVTECVSLSTQVGKWVKFCCRFSKPSLMLSVRSVVSMKYAFVLGGNPCSCCVGCGLSWEITKQTCCFRLIENVPEELTLLSLLYLLFLLLLLLLLSHWLCLLLLPFLLPRLLRCPGVPLPLLTLNLRHHLSYQHLIFSSFSTTSMFHRTPSTSLLSTLYSLPPLLSPILFSSYSSLSVRPQLSPECLPAWMVTIVLLLAVGMKVGLLYKPGDGLRNG